MNKHFNSVLKDRNISITSDNKGNSMEYILLNKNRQLLKFNIISIERSIKCDIIKQYEELPLWIGDVARWIINRCSSSTSELASVISSMIDSSIHNVIRLTLCLSLNDTLWVKPSNMTQTWEEVNLYTNKFNEIFYENLVNNKVISTKDIIPVIPDFTTTGSFDKCWHIDSNDNKIKLIKTSDVITMTHGIESECEVCASQIFNKLIKDSVEYTLLRNVDNVSMSQCDLFTSQDYGYKSYYDIYGSRNNPLYVQDVYDKLGCGDEFRRMIIADYITCNVDRHFGNFGFKINNDTYEIISINNMFDYNLAFIPYFTGHDIYDAENYVNRVSYTFPHNPLQFSRSCLTDKIKSELKNLKQMDIDVECSDAFTRERLQFINDFKDYRINQLLEV